MTESEIMKALECCSKVLAESCAECPLQKVDCLKVNIEELALDLINRKNAEIERLKSHSGKCIYLSDDETTEYCVEGICPKYKTEGEIRAEAIKEFIATLKSKKGIESFCGYRIFDWELDQIAKEMGVE